MVLNTQKKLKNFCHYPKFYLIKDLIQTKKSKQSLIFSSIKICDFMTNYMWNFTY